VCEEMNWIISNEEQAKLDYDRYINIALAFIGPDMNDESITDYLTSKYL
jgi:hypothetical protein